MLLPGALSLQAIRSTLIPHIADHKYEYLIFAESCTNGLSEPNEEPPYFAFVVACSLCLSFRSEAEESDFVLHLFLALPLPFPIRLIRKQTCYQKPQNDTLFSCQDLIPPE